MDGVAAVARIATAAIALCGNAVITAVEARNGTALPDASPVMDSATLAARKVAAAATTRDAQVPQSGSSHVRSSLLESTASLAGQGAVMSATHCTDGSPLRFDGVEGSQFATDTNSNRLPASSPLCLEARQRGRADGQRDQPQQVPGRTVMTGHPQPRARVSRSARRGPGGAGTPLGYVDRSNPGRSMTPCGPYANGPALTLGGGT